MINDTIGNIFSIVSVYSLFFN